MTEHGERSPEQDPGWPEFGPDAGPRPCDTGPHPGDLVRTWAARLAALPPRWRYLLLMARIVDTDGPVRLRDDLDAQSLERSPFLTNARLLLGKLMSSPQAATAKGNLSRSLVREMAAEMRMPETYAEWQPYVKVTREADVWPLEVLRVVLQVAGLIRKYKGVFQVTRKGAALYEDAAAGKLFAHLFRSYFGKFNLGYLDMSEDDPGMQRAFPHSLWLISMLGKDWMDVRTLRDLIFAEQDPEQLEAEHESRRAAGPSRYVSEPWRLFERRVLRPLVDFGLLESRVDPEATGDRTRAYSEPSQVRKTPLFDKFVEFELAPQAPVVVGGAGGEQIARLKVKLKGVTPPIWRRIEVPLSFSFRRLSDIIVAAFGWSNSHLHEFRVGTRGEPGERWLVMVEFIEDRMSFFGAPPEDDNAAQLAEILQTGERLAYSYDFGDGWQFGVLVEEVFTAAGGVVYPRVTHGRRAAPPEDCGGVWGYEEILALRDGLLDADQADDPDRLEWVRDRFPYWEPERFELDAANEWVLDAQPFWE